MASIQASFAPLASPDPGTIDNDDLEPLREVVGNARLVGLGETAHYSAEMTQLRDRITRLLVTELGFSALAVGPPFQRRSTRSACGPRSL